MNQNLTSDAPKKIKRKGLTRPRLTTRSPSASEIARNIKNFETWSAYQCCEQVSYSDIPEPSKADVVKLFDVTRRIPSTWADKTSKEYRTLSKLSTPGFLDFIQDAHREYPALFYSNDAERSSTERELHAEVSIVFYAWKRLHWMRKSHEKWSEADYAANVYNVFRSPAVQESTHRVHCSISLPQPLVLSNMGTQASRILNTKTVAPDWFEFASSFWEDKKPVHQLLEDAYRQNRMATAAAVRHLHSLHIYAPILGLIWASGTVRAHVDWCSMDEEKPLAVLSAPYPGTIESSPDETTFHEWQLDRPCDILAVYFLIRNLDRWTNTTFRDLVVNGVNNLMNSVVDQDGKYFPWKRVGDLGAPPLASTSEKENISISTSAQSTPPKTKHKRHRTW